MKYKGNKGITLIMLIITIIVLLIIAGITIIAVTGGEGTMEKANQAKLSTEAQAEMEELQKVINESAANGLKHGNFSGSADVTTIKNALKNNSLIKENPDDVFVEGKSTWVVTGKKSGYCFTISSNGEVSIIKSIKDIKPTENNVTALSSTQNTIVQDDLGNTITIPAGFGIASDSGTKVEEGIVIEDATSASTAGSQFVWIPVGNGIKVSSNVSSRNTDGTIDIKLGRYSDINSNPIQDASNGYVKSTSDYGILFGNEYFYEFARKQAADLGDSESVEIFGSETDNTKALNIQEFVSSAINNKGYYIARFEAGVIGTENIESNESSTYTINNTTFNKNTVTANSIVCKKGMAVWNYINQPNAAQVCQNMYSQTSSNNKLFVSDLINSYAWDTTVVFLQKCGDKDLAITSGTAKNEQIGKTGENILLISDNIDKQCNIYDIIGNVREWTTESYTSTPHYCVYRGGYYNAKQNAIFRTYYGITYADKHIAFRPILYIK